MKGEDPVSAIVQSAWCAGYLAAVARVKERLDRPLSIMQLIEECKAIVDGKGDYAIAPNVDALLREALKKIAGDEP